ncbi:DUF2577 family protein [Bengtsoniella intestinalis]|uniref:DUF2577 family protein n=1 Tax=Bengtsoniella intestinalis TaxID=3073143 RepID=UPI00391F54A8
MLEQMRAIAQQTNQAAVPAQFMFATVTALSPLTVQVDDRFYLSAPALIALASHTHEYAQGDTDVNTPLELGDSVAILRNLGGQSYLLLGRVRL